MKEVEERNTQNDAAGKGPDGKDKRGVKIAIGSCTMTPTAHLLSLQQQADKVSPAICTIQGDERLSRI